MEEFNEDTLLLGECHKQEYHSNCLLGHIVKKSLAFAYVNSGFESPGTTFDIRILGERRRATVLAQAAWDPANERLKG